MYVQALVVCHSFVHRLEQHCAAYAAYIYVCLERTDVLDKFHVRVVCFRGKSFFVDWGD